MRAPSTRALVFLAFVGCGSSGESQPLAPGADAGDGAAPDSGAPATGCHATPLADTAPVPIVVSHPFKPGDDAGYELLTLTSDGAVTRPRVSFRMKRNAEARIVFTPDGAIGLSPEDGGAIGVFRVEAGPRVTVVEEAHVGSYSADQLVMSPDGSRVYVLDLRPEKAGGGIFEVGIGCDGRLEDRGRISADSPSAMTWVGPGKALVYGPSVLGVAAELHLVDFAARPPVRLAGGAVFGDDKAIASGLAVSPDGRLALVSDTSVIAGNRLGVVDLSGGGVRGLGVLPVDAPVAVAFSPFGNAALVASDDGKDAYVRARLDPANAQAPVALDPSPIPYRFGKPELPGPAHVITRGPLKGRVLLPEVAGLRQLAFTEAGAVEDVSLTKLSADGNDLAGALGAMGAATR